MSSQDEVVLTLLRTIEQRKEEIKVAKSRPNWQTSCSISYNPDASLPDRTNIQTVKDQSKLVELFVFLQSKAYFWDTACGLLDVKLAPSYMGYPIDAWKADIKTRVNQLQVEAKQKELDTLDKRVNGLVSIEQRRTLEIEAIKKELGVK